MNAITIQEKIAPVFFLIKVKTVFIYSVAYHGKSVLLLIS